MRVENYTREEWEESFPEEPYWLDQCEEDRYLTLSLIGPPHEIEEEE